MSDENTIRDLAPATRSAAIATLNLCASTSLSFQPNARLSSSLPVPLAQHSQNKWPASSVEEPRAVTVSSTNSRPTIGCSVMTWYPTHSTAIGRSALGSRPRPRAPRRALRKICPACHCRMVRCRGPDFSIESRVSTTRSTRSVNPPRVGCDTDTVRVGVRAEILDVAAELTARGILTPTGARWHAQTVLRVLGRAGSIRGVDGRAHETPMLDPNFRAAH
jgi:hypothetical protein